MKYDEIFILSEQVNIMARLTISMPDAMSDFITAEIATGKYDNVSEYLRDLVRHEQERREAACGELREMLIAAKESGISTASMEDIQKRVKERLQRAGNHIQD